MTVYVAGLCAQRQDGKAVESGQDHRQSYGGSIKHLWISGLPKGLGQPVFGKLKSSLAEAFLGIGATTALEIGEGFIGVTKSGQVFHHAAQGYVAACAGGFPPENPYN